MNFNFRWWLLGGMGLFFSVALQAQEVQYPDYRSMTDSIGRQFAAFFERNKEIDANNLQSDLVSEMRADNKIFVNKMPSRRGKKLSGKDLYRLCKKSTLMVGWKDWNSASGRFLATAVTLTADGICATNYHVIAEAVLSGALNGNFEKKYLFFVMQEDGRIYPLKKVLAADPLNDFAIFQVETGKDRMTPMPLGEPAFEGEDAYCLSNPQGNLFYLTKGIVSRNHSIVNRKNLQVRTEMQITADYAVGSSGGPIIDNRGNLIGLVSSTRSIYPDSRSLRDFQMSMKNCVPVKLIKECFVLKNKK